MVVLPAGGKPGRCFMTPSPSMGEGGGEGDGTFPPSPYPLPQGERGKRWLSRQGRGNLKQPLKCRPPNPRRSLRPFDSLRSLGAGRGRRLPPPAHTTSRALVIVVCCLPFAVAVPPSLPFSAASASSALNPVLISAWRVLAVSTLTGAPRSVECGGRSATSSVGRAADS